MGYIVEKRTNNGYRCACCHRASNTTEFIDGRAEALAHCPTVHADADSYLDGELESVSVRDGTNGTIIAEATLCWHGGRGKNYQVSRWFGHVDNVRFEEIQGGRPGETWTDIVKRIDQDKAAVELKKAEEELARAQAKVESLREK